MVMVLHMSHIDKPERDVGGTLFFDQIQRHRPMLLRKREW